jgi:hypothetical protein
VESAFEATRLVPIDPDRPVRSSLLRVADSPNVYLKCRTSYISGKLATGQEVQDELMKHKSIIFPEEPDKILDGHTQWVMLVSDPRSAENPHGHLLCCPESFRQSERIQAVQEGLLNPVAPNLFTRTVFRYERRSRDGSDLARLVQTNEGKRTCFMCETPAAARRLSEIFAERGISHQHIPGRMPQAERNQQWAEYSTNPAGSGPLNQYSAAWWFTVICLRSWTKPSAGHVEMS